MLFFPKKKQKSKFNWILVSYSVDTCYYSDFFISTFIFYSSVLPVPCNELWNILQFVYIFSSCTYSFPNVKELRVYDCTYLKRMQEARSKTHTLWPGQGSCVSCGSLPPCVCIGVLHGPQNCIIWDGSSPPSHHTSVPQATPNSVRWENKCSQAPGVKWRNSAIRPLLDSCFPPSQLRPWVAF